MAWIGNRVCHPTIIMFGVTPVLTWASPGNFRCGISRPLVHAFSTLTILPKYYRVTHPVVPSSRHPSWPLYEYLISFITHRIFHPVVPSSRRPVVPSSLCPCPFVLVPLSRSPFVPSSLCPDYLLTLIYHNMKMPILI